MQPAEAARNRIRQLLRRILAQPDTPLPPPFLARFLEQVWVPYLAAQLQARGEGVLRPAGRLSSAFLYSMIPAPELEQRRRLRAFIRELLPLLREALERSDWSEEQGRRFIDQLAEWHISILQTGEPPRTGATEQEMEDTVPLAMFTGDYGEYLHHFEHGIEVIDLDQVPAPWVPGEARG